MSASAEPTRKFKMGQQVKLYRNIRGAPLDALVYEVTRLLPAESDDFQYGIRTLDGRTSRVALESQLLQASAPAEAAAKLPL